MWKRKDRANKIEHDKKAALSTLRELNKTYGNEYTYKPTEKRFAYWYVDIVPTVDIPGLAEAYKLLWPGLKSSTKDFKKCEVTLVKGHFLPTECDCWFTNDKLDLNKICYVNYFFNPRRHFDTSEFFALPTEVQALFGVDESYRKKWQSMTTAEKAAASVDHTATSDIFTLTKYKNNFKFVIAPHYYESVRELNSDTMSKHAKLTKKLYKNGECHFFDDHSSDRWEKIEAHKKERVAYRSNKDEE